jgi:hypothetical protein
MPEFIEIKLSNDKVIKVYSPPSIQLNQIVMRKYPDPVAPVRESPTVGGGTARMSIDNDPDYLREKERVEELRAEERGSLTTLFALKDEVVPDDFTMDAIGEIVTLSTPDWKPREGKVGRKLDYFEWVLLANMGDQIKFQEALAELSGINMDAVRANEDAFRDKVAREES